MFSASLRNFGTKVGEFFGRKKKDVAKEAEEAETEVVEAVDRAAEKAAKTTNELKDELSNKMYANFFSLLI